MLDRTDLNPTPQHLVVAGIALLLTASLAALAGVAAFVESDPFAFALLLFIGPVTYFFAKNQYVGTFHASPPAARRVGNGCYVLGVLLLFGYFANVVEYFWEGGRSLAVAVDLAPLLLLAAALLVCGRSNKVRANALNALHLSAPELHGVKPATTKQGPLLGLGVVAVALAGAYWLIHAQPAKHGEHLSRESVQFLNLPVGATDVSYRLGWRGTKGYEFTIDEPAFRAWVAAGVGSIEANRSGTTLQEIAEPIDAVRYALEGYQTITVTNGLHYTWRKSDRGTHAVFDRSTGRAYYYFHAH